MKQLLYGVAYYDEYMPQDKDRIDRDMEMMQKAGINVIRIAESTWATEEPENGVFDFTHVTRALEAAEKAGISVIVGTPTYAVPPWLAAQHPEVLAVTERGPGKYGARQIMDITSPAYLFHGERIIRRLLRCVQKYGNVIGFQLDNETKHYHTAGPNVQKRFVKYLREKFQTVEALNRAFGFNYWSNRVDCWENVPDVTGSINGSFRAEFEKFRRMLVTEYLAWQSDIVREYLKEGQFITHNFDYEWRGYSFGVQPDVNHKEAAQALTVAGCDIYHPTQDLLTGAEIAFGGDVCRSLRQDNYLVLETQAQGFPEWTPYDGQLRLQAFSHLASGANAVMYWHWHSIHNSFETYWKGLLSHELEENAPYREACTIGADFARLSPRLVNLRKKNRAALLLSNEALTALEQFRMMGGKVRYNDVVRLIYDALYELNVECDVLFPTDTARLADYAFVAVPALYSAPDSLLLALKDYVQQGGCLLGSFKTGFTNEHVAVAHEPQPHLLTECFGVTYDQFTEPREVTLTGDGFSLSEEERQVSVWMELLRPGTAKTLSSYRHANWGKYAAVTVNAFGKGTAAYLGCQPTKAYVKALLRSLLGDRGLLEAAGTEFPVIVRGGVNEAGRKIRYYFNYTGETREQRYPYGAGTELLSGKRLRQEDSLTLAPWGIAIVEEEGGNGQ